MTIEVISFILIDLLRLNAVSMKGLEAMILIRVEQNHCDSINDNYRQ